MDQVIGNAKNPAMPARHFRREIAASVAGRAAALAAVLPYLSCGLRIPERPDTVMSGLREKHQPLCGSHD
jgi:hypothetical protein